jgi:hypothetical protein
MRQVNLKPTNIIHQKNNFRLEIYRTNFLDFTEKLIIFYTIIHELSGTKQREFRIENKRS